MLEYEKAFTVVPSRGASRKRIGEEDVNLLISVDTLVKSGVLVGQKQMDEDALYFLNPERANPYCRQVKNWNIPTYLDPLDRLHRPTQVQIKQERAEILHKAKNNGIPMTPTDAEKLVLVRHQLRTEMS